MAEMQAWERIVERNRMAETLQRNAYRPQGERLELIEDAGQLDKALRRIAAAEQRITRLEIHCAWMQREQEAMVRRLTTLECSLARVEQRLDANDEGAARLEELAIARAKRAAY